MAWVDPKTGKKYKDKPPRVVEREATSSVLQEQKDLEAQIALLERQQVILNARDSYLPYVKFTMPDPAAPGDVKKSKYEAQRFHVLVADVLEKFVKGRLLFDDGRICRNLIFVMPPRHGKTQLTSKHLTAWYSGRNPTHDVGVASYSDEMAADIGADTRAILTSTQHRQVFPSYRLRRGGTAKDNIQTDQGGRLVFVGRGGALTGRGMHLGIGDDLFKDYEEARSQAIRDQAWNWFTRVFMTRRMGPQLVILTFTRWHSDDLIGRLTDPENPCYNAEEAKNWKIIRLPALAEDNDPLGRSVGEPLWPGPGRYGKEMLESLQRLDPLGFASLYQQRPTVADGILFRRENIRFYRRDELPKNLRIYASSDHAVGTNQRNDPTVLLVGGVDEHDNLYLLDCWWQRQPTDVVVQAMLEMNAMRRPLLWWAESGHITKSIGPFLRKRMLEMQNYINIREVTPTKDKETRAQPIAARTAMGKVLFPRDAVWTERAVNELLSFPNGVHDDFVDALAWLGIGLPSQIGAAPDKPVVKAPEFGTLAWVKWTDKWRSEQEKARAAGGF